MGYKNYPQILQRIMNKLFARHLRKGIEVYMDDIVIHAATREKHDIFLGEALRKLEDNKMRININKVQLCLKEGMNEWKWTENMKDEFVKLKGKVKTLGKTDAFNIGMGAVLMQKNDEEEWGPVQWASKKFTPTESKYGISEKEMYAIYWGIKKFEYELRGRKFKVETDHKAQRSEPGLSIIFYVLNPGTDRKVGECFLRTISPRVEILQICLNFIRINIS
ncbi:reverse transcriptase domain-containing protein [Vairimorpha necatrix]|uniref:Reverse transcriptase domain-containing protein n=1 Tax=Vairimorpha necatrix TaxID=6039 RepID=A0AAX4JFP1_9MICR